MLDAKAREALAGVQGAIGKGIARLGVSADALTVVGLGVTGVAAWRVLEGEFFQAAVLLAIGGILDVFDGAVARARDESSARGAFLDSVADRFSDALILAAVAWFYLGLDHHTAGGLALGCLVLAQATSYIRARAESLGFDCRVGVVERAERVVIITLGFAFGTVVGALWVLGVLSALTVLQRLVHVWKQGREPGR